MTTINVSVGETYIGNGVRTEFPIPFDYLPQELEAIRVKLILRSTGVETPTSAFSFDLADRPQNVIMDAAPGSDYDLRVYRHTERKQPISLGEDGQEPYAPEAIEQQLDRTMYILQEIDGGEEDAVEAEEEAAAAASTSMSILDWATATDYLENQVVLHLTHLYRCLVDHTSDTFSVDFTSNGYWEEVIVQGIKGDTGDVGDVGPTGATGATGAAGAAGAAGADGIFSAIASQGEAQTGTNNTKGMTPLRTAEAIAALGSALVTAVTARVSALEAQASTFEEDIEELFGLVELNTGRWSGSQRLLNNQAVAVELLGSGNQYGRGSALSRDGDGTEFAEVMMYFKRVVAGASAAFSSTKIIMQFVDDTWYISRADSYQLVETLVLDGVTLSVATDGNKVGLLSYISSNIPAQDDILSYMKWIGLEIPLGV